ncbi:desmoglein-2-like protein [Conger conger]|uniref:desmoglein-2-like protein n=1 Tax=Conger conger TaxID=82655 RepID=UPI002A59F2E9|nr:desmoglein-2-like protein [Conger conger]
MVRTGNLQGGNLHGGNLYGDSSMGGTLHKVSERLESRIVQGYETERLEASRADEEDALPYAYFRDYYWKKCSGVAEVKDSMREYEYEGGSSAAGSVSGISELEVDFSLDFLDGLDSKFATLAEICKQQEAVTEDTTDAPACVIKTAPPSLVDDVFLESVDVEKVNVKKVNVKKVNVKKVKVKKVNAEKVNVEKVNVEKVNVEKVNVEKVNMEKVHVEKVKASTIPRRVVRENVLVQNQAFMVQQPVFYAAAPVIQAQYVVRPQIQPSVLVPDNQQHLYVVNDPPVHGGVIGVPQGTLRRESFRLVRKPGDEEAVKVAENVVLVERPAASGPVLQAGRSWTLPRSPTSGPQKILLVEREATASYVPGRR